MAVQKTDKNKAHQSDETKAQILEHALTAFSRKGFDGTSIRDIAASAGLNHGLLRYYFVNKEILWKEAVSFLFDRQARYLKFSNVEIATMTGRERFVEWIYRYVNYCAEHPEHARIMMHESMTGGERFRWQAEEFIRPGHERILPFFEDLIEEGVLPDIPLPTLLYTLIGAAQTAFVLASELDTLYNCDMQKKEHIQKHAQTIVDLFVLPSVSDSQS